ncbi:class V aminotransferase [Actinoplanes sp. OR16]|nr:class V aminotransferase [Actinoplanes sp. OR16]
MVPGPTPLPPAVTAAATRPMEDERTVRFAALFTRVVDNLRRLIRTENEVLVFTSSTTGAFESAVQNLFSPGDRVLVANNGAFGQRWVEMSRAYGLEVVEVRAPWGEEIDPARVAAALAADPGITAAMCVHCETSTGVVNDIQGFGEAAAGVLTLVDSASGLGACDLRADEWGLDVVVSGGQKALMTPPGVAFLSVSDRAWERHAEARLPRYYFDWGAARDAYAAAIPRTSWTPAIGVLVALDAALEQLFAEGLDAVFDRHRTLGRLARSGLRGAGLELLTPAQDRHASVTAAYVPDGIDADQLVDLVAERYGVQIVGGSGPLAGRIIRLGHCGYIDALDVISAIAAVELSLRELGAPVQPGAGTVSAMQLLSSTTEARTPNGALIALAAGLEREYQS